MRGNAQRLQQVPIPGLGACIQQRRGGGNGVFVFLHARQQKMQVVGHGEEGGGLLKIRGALFLVCHQLIDGVELLLLNAGFGV